MRLRWLAAFLPAILLAPGAPLHAQLQPPSTGGLARLEHERLMLGHYERVLVIGAHPDDEDTELLTLLVRGYGAEAAYLALNRGEGGQNLIGSELGEALGLLRTEELLSARRLDGARQYFTRAYDFGFSKTLDDTWAHWPRDSVLKDVVRIVRRFRPQVIVSIFSGTPRDGHGQHQAAGWAAREAFRIAGDPSRFPELAAEEHLAPWTPLKLYRSARFDTAATTLTLEGGALDPAVGQTFHQIAMEGRSRHRSQDMGQLQRIGPSPVRLALWDDRTGRGEPALFAGVDTTLTAMAAAGGAAPDTSRWRAIAAALTSTARLTLPALRSLRDSLSAAAGVPGPELVDQLRHLDAVIAGRSELLCDAVAGADRVTPGEAVPVSTGCTSAVVSPPLPRLAFRGNPVTPSAGLVQVPDTAALTTPYFLRAPRIGDLYSWRGVPPEIRGLPREPPTFSASFDGIEREVAYRYNDQASGEQRRPVVVVPRIGVTIDPDTALWPLGSRAPHRLQVTLVHGGPDTTSGRVRLEVPAGWSVPPPQDFRLHGADASATFEFTVRVPESAAAGAVAVRAVAEDAAGRRYDMGVFTIDYPHIRARTYTAPAVARIVVAPLALPRLARVGYVRGAADRVPEALVQSGVPVELLDAAALARGDLSRYDAIVIGPRAYEVDAALVAHNDRLLDYARAGGLLLVQYQQYQFVRGGFVPFPLTIATPHDRVTDENAAVRVLAPGSPVVQRPNPIGADDWRGWVQERGLYFAHTWSDAYQPVLESHDPGDGEQRGGLLVAPLGRGTYVYTGLAFFRELPAGVPGAYRLFANLLGLSRRASP